MPSADATSTPRHPTDPPRAEFRHSYSKDKAQLRRRSERDPVKTEMQQLALADFCQAIFALNEFIYVD